MITTRMPSSGASCASTSPEPPRPLPKWKSRPTKISAGAIRWWITSLRKASGALGRELDREPLAHQDVDAEPLEVVLQLVPGHDQGRELPIRLEHPARMRIERINRRGAAERACALHHRAEQRLMPQVNAVEVPDRQHQATVGVGEPLATPVGFASRLPL